MQNAEIEKTTAVIQRNFPKLEVNSITYVGEGMDSKAFLVNDELIFRFPKLEEVAKQLEVEIALLPKLQKIFTLAIPDFEYIGEQENGFSFVGYKKIHGEELSRKVLGSLDSRTRDNIFKQLSNFLQQIHAFPLVIAKQCGVKMDNTKENYLSDFREIKNRAFSILDEETKAYVTNLYETYLADKANFLHVPALLHADFSPNHILFDNRENVVSGVIDFGDVNIDDLDYDLMYLYMEWGEEYVRELLKFYPHENHERLMKKLHFYSRANTVQDVLIGLNRNDTSIQDYALKRIQKEMKL